MTQDDMKRAAARAALKYVPENAVIGVGTGSTVNFFIEALGEIAGKVRGAVVTSEDTRKRLLAIGVEIVPLSDLTEYPAYFDGADEVSTNLQMIKGGGGALLREKIVSTLAERIICMADESKLVKKLGKFPLPVEVIPEARSLVSRELVKMGGTPELRVGVKTHYGNDIVDVSNLDINEPIRLEERINALTGVVENGLFAKRGADLLILATSGGVEIRNPMGETTKAE